MNHKMFQLAEEAELLTGVWAVPDFILERFAQSLVKECMIVCGAVQGAGELSGKVEFAAGAGHAKEMIRKHFELDE